MARRSGTEMVLLITGFVFFLKRVCFALRYHQMPVILKLPENRCYSAHYYFVEDLCKDEE